MYDSFQVFWARVCLFLCGATADDPWTEYILLPFCVQNWEVSYSSLLSSIRYVHYELNLTYFVWNLGLGSWS